MCIYICIYIYNHRKVHYKLSQNHAPRRFFVSEMCFPQTKKTKCWRTKLWRPRPPWWYKEFDQSPRRPGLVVVEPPIAIPLSRLLTLDVPTNQWWVVLLLTYHYHYGRGLRWYGWYMWLVILASLLHLIWYHWRNLGAVSRCSWVLEWWCLWYRWWTSWDTENTAMNLLDIRISTNTGFI